VAKVTITFCSNNNNNSLHTDKIHKRYTSAASECITTHNRAEQQKNIEHNINNHKKLQLSQKITKKNATLYIFLIIIIFLFHLFKF